MKLNYDCVRAVLRAIDDLNKPIKNIRNEDDLYKVPLPKIRRHPLVSEQYSELEIQQAIRFLLDGQYVIGVTLPKGAGPIRYCDIDKITQAGYKFLEEIEPESEWEKIKKKAWDIGKTLHKPMEVALTIATKDKGIWTAAHNFIVNLFAPK